MLEGIHSRAQRQRTINTVDTRIVLFLVHHGDAVGPDVNPMRPLSDSVCVEVDMLAQKAAERGAKPDRIWHSGFVPAKPCRHTGSGATRLRRSLQCAASAAH